MWLESKMYYNIKKKYMQLKSIPLYEMSNQFLTKSVYIKNMLNYSTLSRDYN